MNQTWRNKPVVDESHSIDLDRQLAHHVGQGADERQAEDAVYHNYKRQNHLDAAAHHLKAASDLSRQGSKLDAEKHHTMYKLHLSALGIKNNMKVPDEVKTRMSAQEAGKSGFFQSHIADRLVTK